MQSVQGGWAGVCWVRRGSPRVCSHGTSQELGLTCRRREPESREGPGARRGAHRTARNRDTLASHSFLSSVPLRQVYLKLIILVGTSNIKHRKMRQAVSDCPSRARRPTSLSFFFVKSCDSTGQALSCSLVHLVCTTPYQGEVRPGVRALNAGSLRARSTPPARATLHGPVGSLPAEDQVPLSSRSDEEGLQRGGGTFPCQHTVVVVVGGRRGDGAGRARWTRDCRRRQRAAGWIAPRCS